MSVVGVGLHEVELLEDGCSAFPAMLSAISAAQSTICLETYILRSDTTGWAFANRLIERAQAGVQVNVIYDDWGSSVSESMRIQLEEAGVRLLAYHPIRFHGRFGLFISRLTRRNHRKSLIVDSAVAFTGGMNIADDYAAAQDGGCDWRDTAVRLEGPAALELQYFFLRTWRRHRGAKLDESRYTSTGRRADPKVRVITSDLHRGRKSIRLAYKDAMRSSQRTIYITAAYFLPDRKFLNTLTDAAKRGIDVKVILAGTTDVRIVLFAARALYERLLKAGVRVFEWHATRVLHAKTAVIDGHWSTVGSSNLDVLSLYRNLEVNAVIEDAEFAAALESLFEKDLKSCEEITRSSLRRWPWWKWLLSRGAFWFRNWL